MGRAWTAVVPPVALGSSTMKLRNRLLASENDNELMASFGAARLVRTLAGRLELQGGTEADREEAWRWVRTFLTGPDGQRLPAIAER